MIRPSGEPPLSESFDLYLLAGQSNMAGRGELEQTDRLAVPGIYTLNAGDQWINQGEPIHFDKPEVVGVGLGFTFALNARKNYPAKSVGLIPCAVGGTPQERWMPGADLYETAVRRTREALKHGRLKAILWHQGESECGDENKARAYGENLRLIVEGFRKDLNADKVPFIAGELGSFLEKRNNQLLFRTVNAQIHLLPTRASLTRVVSAAGLEANEDQLHFNARSLKEFGQRYFKAYLTLHSKS